MGGWAPAPRRGIRTVGITDSAIKHLASDWLAEEYRRAAALIDADAAAVSQMLAAQEVAVR